VIDEAKAAQPIEPRGRTDLRAVPLVTIDPPDAATMTMRCGRAR